MKIEQRVVILRGTSSSGKSSIAKLFSGKSVICCADDHFTDSFGRYIFRDDQVDLAHHKCKSKFIKAIENPKVKTIIVANTNTKPSDYQFYIDEAEKRGIMVFSLVVERRHNNKNDHNVPEHVLARQEQNIKQSLKLR